MGRRTAATEVLAPARSRSHGGAPPIASSQSPLSSVSACGENCARSLAPPLPAARGAAGAPFGLARKENGPCTVQKKRALWRAPVQWPSARRGSAYRCKRRFCLAFGHAMLFCEFVTAVPWRMVQRASGWSSHCLCSSFRCRWPGGQREPVQASTPARGARSGAERAERGAGQMRSCSPILVGTRAAGIRHQACTAPRRARRGAIANPQAPSHADPRT